MAADDEKQDEVQRLLQAREDGAVPKPPGTFTQFFELNKVRPQPSSGSPGQEAGPLGSSLPPSSASSKLNEDAPLTNTSAAAEQADLGLDSGIPPSNTEAWNAATVRPRDPQPYMLDGFFHNENKIEPVQASSSGFGQTFDNAGSGPFAPAHRGAGVFPVSGNEYLEAPNDNIGPGPMVVPESHSGNDRQKATRLFSPTKPMAEPVVPLHGPSAYTRVIDSSAQRAEEQQASLIPSPAGNAAPQAPTPASAPVPFVAPQWPNPQMYPLAYPPQVSVPLPASPPVSAQPVPQPQVRPAEPTPQPGWIAYMPMIIGLNVLLFLTAIFILIFALSSK